jgi:signal transduction histidine kinase
MRASAVATTPGWRDAALRYCLWGLGYIVGYLLLDWISFIYGYSGLGITPWNPPPGLSLALLLRRGIAYSAWLVPAALIADVVVRDVPAAWPALIASAAIIAGGYSATAHVLRKHLPFDPRIERLRDVSLLFACSFVGAAIVAILNVGVFVVGGNLTWQDYPAAVARFLVGDLNGIAVVTPLLLREQIWHEARSDSQGRLPLFEMLVAACGVAVALWVVFGLESTDEFKFFYLLFVPVVIIALRYGLDGACLALLGVQLGTILLVQLRDFHAATVTEFQVLILALTLTGLLTGTVVSERWRAERAVRDGEIKLREKEAELAHVARLSMMGEMASVLAHELNQPLTATKAYTNAALLLLQKSPMDVARASTAMSDAMMHADQAGLIIRRIRDYLRKGDARLEPVTVAAIFEQLAAFVRATTQREGVEIRFALGGELPRVVADRVQIVQVLLNLLRNSFEAMRTAGTAQKTVTISAVRGASDSTVEFAVSDSGPGIPPDVAAGLFVPFTSNKTQGMGLGLTINRSIVEAHGGRLWHTASASQGAEFRFTLRVAEGRG